EAGGAWQWRQSREVVEIEEGVTRIAEGQRGALTTSRQLDWGDYELMLTESANGAEASHAFFAGWGGQPTAGEEAPDRVRVQVPEALPAPGKTVEITLLPPYEIGRASCRGRDWSSDVCSSDLALTTSRQLDWGDYELMLTESANGAEASHAFFAGWGGQPTAGEEAPDRVRVQVPEALPAPGKTVEITLLPPY